MECEISYNGRVTYAFMRSESFGSLICLYLCILYYCNIFFPYLCKMYWCPCMVTKHFLTCISIFSVLLCWPITKRISFNMSTYGQRVFGSLTCLCLCIIYFSLIYEKFIDTHAWQPNTFWLASLFYRFCCVGVKPGS